MLLDVHDIDEQVPDDPYRRAKLYRWKHIFWEEINEPRINSFLVDPYGSQEADDEMYMVLAQQEADIDEDDDDDDDDDNDEEDNDDYDEYDDYDEEEGEGDNNDSNAKSDN